MPNPKPAEKPKTRPLLSTLLPHSAAEFSKQLKTPSKERTFPAGMTSVKGYVWRDDSLEVIKRV